MTRLIVLCQRPLHVPTSEGLAWLERERLRLPDLPGLGWMSLTQLESPSLRWARQWDWLIEIELGRELTPQQLLEEPSWSAFFGDLRLLGMRPSVAVADPALSTALPSSD